MILVLAGNYYQYSQWVKRNGFARGATKYVSEPGHYLGRWGCDFVMVGEYQKNPVFRDPAFEVYAVTHGFNHRADISEAPVISGT